MEAVFSKNGVVDTYLNGIDSNGHFTLFEAIEPEVRALAEQHTLVAGEAVHIAKVMLDTVVEFDSIEPEFKIQGDSPEIFSLYPNPAKEQILLSGKLLSGDEIRMWTLEGTLLQTIVVRDETTQQNISLLNIQTGTYLLEINRTGLKLHTSPIVKL